MRTGPFACVFIEIEELVEARVGEVGGVRTAEFVVAHLRPEQEEEVLGIGVVGAPAELEELVGAVAELFLELVVVAGLDPDVEAEPLPGVRVELDAGSGRRSMVLYESNVIRRASPVFGSIPFG